MGSTYRWNSCSADQQPNQTDRERRRPDKTEQVDLSTEQTSILHQRIGYWCGVVRYRFVKEVTTDGVKID